MFSKRSNAKKSAPGRFKIRHLEIRCFNSKCLKQFLNFLNRNGIVLKLSFTKPPVSNIPRLPNVSVLKFLVSKRSGANKSARSPKKWWVRIWNVPKTVSLGWQELWFTDSLLVLLCDFVGDKLSFQKLKHSEIHYYRSVFYNY